MMKTNRLQRPQSIDTIISAGNTEKEESKQTPKQQSLPQNINTADESTIIADKKLQEKGLSEPEEGLIGMKEILFYTFMVLITMIIMGIAVVAIFQ